MLPPSNLCDCRPFKSEHRDGFTAEQQSQWVSLIQRARDCYHSDVENAATILRQALELDDRHALTHFELGKCFESLHHPDLARKEFVRARDEDICPLRIITPLEQSIREVTEKTGTPLIDAHQLLEQHCRDGILGDYLLVDHVHPSFRGHQLIANALVEAMSAQKWVSLPADWKARSETAYAKHFASLDSIYFLRGQRMRENLRAWAAGHAEDGLSPPATPPLRRPRK